MPFKKLAFDNVGFLKGPTEVLSRERDMQNICHNFLSATELLLHF